MISIFRYFFIALLLAFGLLTKSWAAADLYSSEEQLEDQSPKHMRFATREALSDVLVRVSGSRELLKRQDIRLALASPDRFLQQYSLVDFEQPEQGELRQRFLFQFDQVSVDRLLQDAGLPVWPANRPPVLLWYVLEDARGRRFLNSEEDPEVVDKIMEGFRKRGLELQLPLYDLEDSTLVEIADVLRLDRPSIASGGMRYGASTILAGRLSQLSSGNWVSDSLYILNGRSYTVPARDGELELLIDSLADFAAVKTSAEYALVITENNLEGIELYLEGVEDFGDYASAVEYFENVQAVDYSNIEYLCAGQAVFRIYFQGQLRQLKQALALDGKLLPLEAPNIELPEYFSKIELAYSWPRTVEFDNE